MKIAKSSKICVLIVALILSLACALSFMRVDVAKADFSLTDYFGGTATKEIDAENDRLVVTANNEQTFEIKNQLLIDDFATEFKITDVKSIVVTVKADSYFETGVRKADAAETDENVTEMEIKIKLDFENHKISVNDDSSSWFDDPTSGDYTFMLKVSNDKLHAIIENSTRVPTTDYYKIGGKDKTPATVSFQFFGTDGMKTEFKYFDQGASVGGTPYRQTFKEEDPEKATPRARVTFGGSYIANKRNELKLLNGSEVKATFTEYSVLGKNGGKFSLAKNADTPDGVVVFSKEDNPSEMKIALNDEVKIDVMQDEKIVETYTITTYEKASDTKAPKYNTSVESEAIDAYKKAVYEATRKEYTVNGEKETHFVKLGDKITIPSLKGFVTDDNTAYERLTHTIYYRTPSSSTVTTDGWTITLSEAGKYQFYVVFKDEADNAMDKDKFYKLDDNGELIAGTYEYEKFVFEFTIEDDAPMIVEAAAVQGKGYLNTQYTFSAFNVEASSYTPSYKLLYSEAKDGKYKEIIAKSKIADEDKYDNEDFTYAEMTGFAYDGKLTFTPVKKGYYKVECTVSSQKVRIEQDSTEAVYISEKPAVVKPDNHWLENNVWSVVFLSIGTLCLIGIVVLLFIKPKEEIDEDVDVK